MVRALPRFPLGRLGLVRQVFLLDLGLRVLPSAQPVPWPPWFLPDLPGLELRVLQRFLLGLELRALLPCPLNQPGQELRVLPLGLGLRALPLGLELRALLPYPLDQPDLPDQEGLEGLGCLHHHHDHVLGRRKYS